MRDKPSNVLFIITDQHRADHVGFMGNTVVRTPQLDALAARGTVFEQAWVANPVCMPNRCSILTGRMPSAHGVIFNDRSLDPGSNTFVRRFRKSGYRTALIGKSHLQHGMSQNAVLAHRGEPAQSLPYAQGWDHLEDPDRYYDERPREFGDFYGFDHVELAIDHGARVSGHHYWWALDKGADPAHLKVRYDQSAPGNHRSEHWWQIYQPPYEERFHSTRFVAERTEAFIEQAVADDTPWLAWCSFPDPHHPMTPPGDWFFRHKPEDMVLPDSRHDTLADAPAHLRHAASIHPQDQREWVAPCGYGNDELLREAIAATYGMVEMIDDGVGRVLSCLERLGVEKNTIVVFTSDHGDMMGEHGLFLKGFMHYRGTLQVPMVVAAPGLKPGRTNALASSMDLGPTLLELCDLAGYDGIQGRSLAPVLNDHGSAVRDSLLIEDDAVEILEHLTPIPCRTRTLVTASGHRYTRNSKGEEQLFDLHADQDEMQDLKASETTLRLQMVERLADTMMAVGDSARGAPAAESM